jgi:hypothetical protein
MAMKIFLGLSVLIWLPYGVYCIAVPEYLAEVAGVAATTATGTTEIRAMYGGLQASIGLLCALGLARPKYANTAATALCFLLAGLFSARLIGFFLDESGSDYTYGTLVFESTYSVIAGFMASRSKD